MSRPLDLAVLLPVYRNATVLEELAARLTAALAERVQAYRIVFVVDASPDDAWTVVSRLAAADQRIAGVLLGRNVGQHQALLTGMRLVRARHLAVMDADLQDPPELVPELLARASATGATAFAARQGRYQSRGRMLTSRLFKGALGLVTALPASVGTFFVVDGAVAAAMAAAPVRTPQAVVLAGCLSPRIEILPYRRAERPEGRSAYSGLGRLRAAVCAVRCAVECRIGGPGRHWSPPVPTAQVNL